MPAVEPIANLAVDQLEVARNGFQRAAGPVGHHLADPSDDVGWVALAEIGRGQLLPTGVERGKPPAEVDPATVDCGSSAPATVVVGRPKDDVPTP